MVRDSIARTFNLQSNTIVVGPTHRFIYEQRIFRHNYVTFIRHHHSRLNHNIDIDQNSTIFKFKKTADNEDDQCAICLKHFVDNETVR